MRLAARACRAVVAVAGHCFSPSLMEPCQAAMEVVRWQLLHMCDDPCNTKES